MTLFAARYIGGSTEGIGGSTELPRHVNASRPVGGWATLGRPGERDELPPGVATADRGG